MPASSAVKRRRLRSEARAFGSAPWSSSRRVNAASVWRPQRYACETTPQMVFEQVDTPAMERYHGRIASPEVVAREEELRAGLHGKTAG
jgi:hypothetical protein